MKKFFLPEKDIRIVPVAIIAYPLSVLQECIFFNEAKLLPDSSDLKISSFHKGIDYVILPLYSVKNNCFFVPQKSGLNQWNACGRKRDPNEVYIPIPKKIHQFYPDFFPSREEHFSLILPNGKSLSAKVCQENSKALMSTHNADLGYWILRQVLNKKEGELVTIEDLNRFGIDSVRIVNCHSVNEQGFKEYQISFTSSDYESYAEFITSD